MRTRGPLIVCLPYEHGVKPPIMYFSFPYTCSNSSKDVTIFVVRRGWSYLTTRLSICIFRETRLLFFFLISWIKSPFVTRYLLEFSNRTGN